MAAFAQLGAGDGGGELSVGDGLGVGVGEALRGEVVDERSLEGLEELRQRAALGFGAHHHLDAVADAAGQLGQHFGKPVGGVDDMAEAVAGGAGPLRAPGVVVAWGIGPAEAFLQRGRDVVELERGVAAVPTEHAEGREVAVRLMEMGEGELALVGAFIAERGDEEKVGRIPSGGLGLVGGGAFLDDEMAEDAAEDHDRKPLLLELDEEDAPRLAVLERSKLVDGLHLHGVLVLEAKLLRLILEGEVVEAVFPERPVEFGFEIADELRESLERAELVGGSGHGAVKYLIEYPVNRAIPSVVSD